MTAPLVPDFSSALYTDKNGKHHLQLMVQGMRCAACAFTIERLLKKQNVDARVNVTENRLSVIWDGGPTRFFEFLAPVLDNGFSLSVCDTGTEAEKQKKEERFLLFCLALSGFASGNIMLLSLGVWTTNAETMGLATRDILHWFSALIALPTVAIAGQPFFRSAWAVLKNGRTNMDVPISLAVTLASTMSVVQTIQHAEHAFFDSAVMLLFFLLIGRYLDFKARGKARSAARDLLSMLSGEATVLENGTPRLIPARDIKTGMVLHVAAGMKILADGIVQTGETEVDTSSLTGETMPQLVTPGAAVYAGMINLLAPITLIVTAEKQQSVMGEIVRLMQNAEQGQARYVQLADKIARAYTPVVHVLALASFLGWLFIGQAGWVDALLIAIAVLIITCPCALGLAVPVVQVLASNRLFRQGILLKAGDALEKLSTIDTIVFDKTGTLTLGKPRLIHAASVPAAIMQKAARLAAHSKHPLSVAIKSVAMNANIAETNISLSVKEIAGKGLEAVVDGKIHRLGNRDFCNIAEAAQDDGMELWFTEEGVPAHRFVFEDELREDAQSVLSELKAKGFQLILYSGDRDFVAKKTGQFLNMDIAAGGMSPKDKFAAIEGLMAKGRKVLYVGDGLNDAAALSVATTSMSPSSAIDISQNAAAFVFHGKKLLPVLIALNLAKKAQGLVKQNFMLALIYNAFAIPLAVAGYVTPLLAALAMSGSSLLVIGNALRLTRMKAD